MQSCYFHSHCVVQSKAVKSYATLCTFPTAQKLQRICLVQGVFHMDPVKQAKAICSHDVRVTALQQQLAEMKSKTSGLESFIRSGMQAGPSPCFPEVPSARHLAHEATGVHAALTVQRLKFGMHDKLANSHIATW